MLLYAEGRFCDGEMIGMSLIRSQRRHCSAKSGWRTKALELWMLVTSSGEAMRENVLQNTLPIELGGGRRSDFRLSPRFIFERRILFSSQEVRNF